MMRLILWMSVIIDDVLPASLPNFIVESKDMFIVWNDLDIMIQCVFQEVYPKDSF